MTEDPKSRLSLALARARRLEPDKSFLELLESMIDSSQKKKSRLLSDSELLATIETWIIRKKSITRRVSGKVEK